MIRKKQPNKIYAKFRKMGISFQRGHTYTGPNDVQVQLLCRKHKNKLETPSEI